MLTSKETECLTPAQRRIANSVDGGGMASVFARTIMGPLDGCLPEGNT